MTVDIVFTIEADAWDEILPGIEAPAAHAARAALDRVRVEADVLEVSIVLADDAFVADLNRRYRGKEGATNVFAFPQSAQSPGGVRLLGDVVLGHETVMAEARAQSKRPEHHVCHLVVHGVLHLCGYDHETGATARDMETLEREILASQSIADPYRDDPSDPEAPPPLSGQSIAP